MNMRKVSALYCTIVGLMMLALWIVLLATDSVPELHTAPIEMILVLVAEFLTLGLLLVSGYGLFTSKKWDYPVFLVALGSLYYSTLTNAGYTLQSGDISQAALMFFFVIVNSILIFITYKPLFLEKQ